MELMRVPDLEPKRLTYEEMALRFPDQGVVVIGSSCFIADSGLACRRTHTQYGVPLMNTKYVSCGPFLQKGMERNDADGLFCFLESKGGGIGEVKNMLLDECELLQ